MIRFFVSILCIRATFCALGGVPGGFSNIQDLASVSKQTTAAANYVVQNNAQYVLHFSKAVSGKQQVVNGMNYEFVLQFDVLASKTGLATYPSSVQYTVKMHQALDQTLSVSSFSAAAPVKCAPGAPCQHSTSDPWVAKAAQFAVDSISSAGQITLTLVRIVSVKTQIVAGVNYIMVIQLSGNAQAADFDVVVYRALDNKLSLTSWKQHELGSDTIPVLEPGPVIGGTGFGQKEKTVLGGYNQVNMQDPTMKALVMAAAKFALKEISSSTGATLQFLGVTDPMEQVVAGTNFKFDVEGGTNPGSKVYSVVVFMPLGGQNHLANPTKIPFKLTSFKQIVVSMPR